MLITRGIEERGHILYRQGKIPGSFYTGRGNEAAAVGVATAMGAGRRRHAAPPRHGRPHHARRRAVADLRAVHGPRRRAHARAGTATSTWPTRSLGLIAMVSHLPAMLPVAVGCALAFRIREEKRVAVGWFGEGAAARGDAHEAMNFAGVRRLPVVFVCDNNQWAYSTPTHLGYAVEHLADRAAAYGFEGVVVDGTDVLAVYREAKRAIEKAREGGGPTLIECLTLRMEGHAVHDDAFYVPKELFEEWAEARSDRALPHLAARERRLLRRGGGRDRGRRQEAPERRAPARRGVAACPTRRRCSTASTRRPRTSTRRTTSSMAEKTYLQAISRRAPAGDAPRQARLRDRRGRRRLRRRVQGHARLPGGVRPLARDRRAALRDGDRRRRAPARRSWACARSPRCSSPTSSRAPGTTSSPSPRSSATAPARRCRSCVRLPSGGGFSGGPFHSQNPESSFAHIPGLKCVCPATPEDAKGLLVSRDRGSEPRPLLRAQAPLPPDQGRGAGRALHDPDRQGAHPPRGRGRHA